jgi:hypothetical protein
MVTPVNALKLNLAVSPSITRGRGRPARPYPVEDFHLLSFAD